MDGVLAEFEARCDRSDPDQLAMLEQMRAHTRRLHQQRGDWNKPNTRRNCNSAAPRTTTTAPKAIAAYRCEGRLMLCDHLILLQGAPTAADESDSRQRLLPPRGCCSRSRT